MTGRHPQRGVMLLELLISGLLSFVVVAGVLMMLQSSYTSRSTIIGQNAVNTDARGSLDLLSDRILNAQMVAGAGVLQTASATSLTCYTDGTGTATTRYWLDTTSTPVSLKQTVGSTTTILLNDVQSLQFTYYVVNGTNFTAATTQWTTTTSPTAPTIAELPNLGAIAITATVNNGGYSRVLKTLVRLRNSPARTRL